MLSFTLLVSLLPLLLLLVSNTQTVHAVDNPSNDTSPLDLPIINIGLLVQEKTPLSIYKFRSALLGTLGSHLTYSMRENLPENAFSSILLDCELSRLHNSDSMSGRAYLEASCNGTALVFTRFGLTASDIHSSVLDALTGNNYWELLRLFVLDDLLNTTDSVDVSMESDLIDVHGTLNTMNTSKNEPPSTTLIVLAVFSTGLGTCLLSLLTFVWCKIGFKPWGLRTGCDDRMKDIDLVAEGGTEMGSDDDIDATTLMNPETRRLPSPISNLSMIDEVEEEDLSTVCSVSVIHDTFYAAEQPQVLSDCVYRDRVML